MDNLGPAGEFLRISEHYRRLADDELLTLARQKDELTEMAQQALDNEMAHRRLKLEPEEVPPPAPEPPKRAAIFSDRSEPDRTEPDGTEPKDFDDPDDSYDPYEEDRALVNGAPSVGRCRRVQSDRPLGECLRYCMSRECLTACKLLKALAQRNSRKEIILRFPRASTGKTHRPQLLHNQPCFLCCEAQQSG